jgi:Gluconate 2-dehydrogenase subunit 3
MGLVHLISGIHHQENLTVAIDTRPAQLSATDRFTRLTRLQRLVDEGAVYVPQFLNLTQFATLRALFRRILPHQSHPAHLATVLDTALATGPGHPIHPAPAFDYQLGLDEIDSIAHTRTGFAFADLTAEIQDAILSLIATRDLTTRRLDLSRWLSDLKHSSSGGLTLQYS